MDMQADPLARQTGADPSPLQSTLQTRRKRPQERNALDGPLVHGGQALSYLSLLFCLHPLGAWPCLLRQPLLLYGV